MEIIIETAAGSDVGRVRDLNEDVALALVGPGGALLAVADGMGGHQAGEIASDLALGSLQASLQPFINQAGAIDATATIVQSAADDTLPGIANLLEKRLRTAVKTANSSIYSYAQENQEAAGDMGCTLTAALIRDNLVIIANIGDSRAYLLRQGLLQQLTEDHSYVNELVRAGHIWPEEIYDHPQRNVITRALGSHPTVQIDIRIYSLQPDDQLLLCSDGLWEMLRDPTLIGVILEEAPDLETAVSDLIDSANNYGGFDNIGLVVAKVTITE